MPARNRRGKTEQKTLFNLEGNCHYCKYLVTYLFMSYLESTSYFKKKRNYKLFLEKNCFDLNTYPRRSRIYKYPKNPGKVSEYKNDNMKIF